MSAENHRNQPDVKKRQLEEVHQTLLSTEDNFSNSKSPGFVKCCRETSFRRFEDKHLQTFDNVNKSGKNFHLII